MSGPPARSDWVRWDAGAYDQQAAPHEHWARAVLERLALAGDETVLDAGCGTGRWTAELRDRLPRGRVIGVDVSAQMIAAARERLGASAELIHADLVELDLETQLDAVFSSATFHWIHDHDRLFAALRRAMRPGARLEAQCGGIGNIAEIERAIDALAGDERFADYLRGERRAWNYAGVGDTEARLRRAGFDSARAWLEPWPVRPTDPAGFLATVILPWHLERLPRRLHESFVEAILGSMPRPLVVGYVRLNISATA